MSKKTKRLVVIVLICLLSLLMILPTIAMIITYANAASSDDIKAEIIEGSTTASGEPVVPFVEDFIGVDFDFTGEKITLTFNGVAYTTNLIATAEGATASYEFVDENGKVVYPINSTYRVKVMPSALNIRSGPGTQYKINGCIRDCGVYTIVETKGNWGLLKSQQGWICLDYCVKV